ncbi:Band 4.1-like protein 4A [Tupaia chinensis]|uniref:Band 4.1-like protein 4A n=1 Tax=Tupaia chinensis TaxID=246437 RepID=L9KWS4_TUPCH|nr:Band 4.1-like protein 4A [Tupaia chinensis]
MAAVLGPLYLAPSGSALAWLLSPLLLPFVFEANTCEIRSLHLCIRPGACLPPLKEEGTCDPVPTKHILGRYQFFLQVKQDVLQGRLPCAVSTAAQLGAYAIQSELGDYDPYKHTTGYVSEYRFVPDQKEELEEAIERIHKTLMGQAPAEAELNYLRTARSLEMYGVDLHPVYGENKSEYFLGLTPVGVVVYKNKKQVGKYFWPRITKVHFKETQFELRVLGKDVPGLDTGLGLEDSQGHCVSDLGSALMVAFASRKVHSDFRLEPSVGT